MMRQNPTRRCSRLGGTSLFPKFKVICSVVAFWRVQRSPQAAELGRWLLLLRSKGTMKIRMFLWMVSVYISALGEVSCTSDNIPFKVSEVNPPDNATEVPLDTDVVVVFNDMVDPASVTTNVASLECKGSVYISQDDFTNCVPMAKPPMAEKTDSQFRIKPLSALRYGTRYKIRVTAQVQNSDGVYLKKVFTMPVGFTTENDKIPPLVADPTFKQKNNQKFTSCCFGNFLLFAPAEDNVTAPENLQHDIYQTYTEPRFC